jgi:[ribosomal protein S5]-alanine N-acetyltransferase
VETDLTTKGDDEFGRESINGLGVPWCPLWECVIETERLLLRQLRPDDLDAMHAYLGDAETMAHYPQPYSREFVKQAIAKNIERYAKHGYSVFGAVLKDTGALVGDCGLVWQEVEGRDELEVGYHFRRDRWRCGYATEAAKACIEFAFEHAGVDHVISLIRPENIASRRVAEKNGLQVVRTVEWKGLIHDVWSISKVGNHTGHDGARQMC